MLHLNSISRVKEADVHQKINSRCHISIFDNNRKDIVVIISAVYRGKRVK